MGFRNVDVHTVPSYWPFDSHDEVAQYMLTHVPAMLRMIRDMSENDIGKVRELILEYLMEKHPATPSRLTGTAIIGVGRK